MPFIRYTRDKRGYEHTYVMHAYRPGQGGSRTRLLYMFRSPASLKVGRKPFDSEVTEALEHTHPDLSFDWTNVPREPEALWQESRDRDRDRGRRPDRGSGGTQRSQAAQPPQVIVEDHSILGQTLGASEANRLRMRYQDLIQRIGRRARTPEERDRLVARAERLNPEEWMDEAAIRAAVASVDAEWDAIAAELPSRRRGRRGGRHRAGARPEPSPAPSAIIEGADEHNENGKDLAFASGESEFAAPSGGGDRRPEPAAGSEPPSAAGDTAEDRDTPSHGTDDVPGGD